MIEEAAKSSWQVPSENVNPRRSIAAIEEVPESKRAFEAAPACAVEIKMQKTKLRQCSELR